MMSASIPRSREAAAFAARRVRSQSIQTILTECCHSFVRRSPMAPPTAPTKERATMGHTDATATPTTRCTGSCHCGAVRFEVSLDLSRGGTRCNCSICTKVGTLSSLVKPEAFTLLQGEDSLSEYR